MKIERGERRVDVDDLVALAAALGVNPNRLVMPPQARRAASAAITEAAETTEQLAWDWAKGEWPLMVGGLDNVSSDDEVYRQFVRNANPAEHLADADQPLHRSARELTQRVETLLEWGPRHRSAAVRRGKGHREVRRRQIESVRRAAAHLLEELDAMEGELDGDR
jgi:hypothetical protein